MAIWKRIKYFFVPCEGNDYRPDVLERLSMGIMLGLVLLSFTMANLQAILWISSDWLVSTILPAVIVDLTNEEREGGSLISLTRNPLLDEAARLKAEDMAKNAYFSHYSPDGISPWHWFSEVSYDFVSAGENLAVHFTESEDVVDAWMESPAHKANIMGGQYQEIGVGTAKGEYKGRPTIFVVQLFGTQKAPLVTSRAEMSEEPARVTVEKVIEPVVERDKVTDVSFGDVAPATIEDSTATRTDFSVHSVPEMEITEETIAPTMQFEDEERVSISQDEVSGEYTALYSDLATTTRTGVPATLLQFQDMSGNRSGVMYRSATDASSWLQIIYAFLTSIVLISLIFSIFIEWRRQHPIQIVYAGGLLAVMALLFYVHMGLTSSVTII